MRENKGFLASFWFIPLLCRERGARALEERLATEKLAAAQSVEESKKDAAENVWKLENSTYKARQQNQ